MTSLVTSILAGIGLGFMYLAKELRKEIRAFCDDPANLVLPICDLRVYATVVLYVFTFLYGANFVGISTVLYHYTGAEAELSVILIDNTVVLAVMAVLAILIRTQYYKFNFYKLDDYLAKAYEKSLDGKKETVHTFYLVVVLGVAILAYICAITAIGDIISNWWEVMLVG